MIVLLTESEIKFKMESQIYARENENPPQAIMLIYNLEATEDKVWIYHDMADFQINNEHQVFEKWGYKSPEILINELVSTLSEKLKNTVHNIG